MAWSTDLRADVDGAPAIDDGGGIFVGTDGGEIVRLDAKGAIVWRTNVGGFVRGSLSGPSTIELGKRPITSRSVYSVSRVKPSFTQLIRPCASVIITALSVRQATRASFRVARSLPQSTTSSAWRDSTTEPSGAGCRADVDPMSHPKPKTAAQQATAIPSLAPPITRPDDAPGTAPSRHCASPQTTRNAASTPNARRGIPSR